MPFNYRKDGGRAVMLGARAEPVVPADAIALVAGVNFATVEKVIAAIYIIGEFSGTGTDELVNLENVPRKKVNHDSGVDADRIRVTREFCEDLADWIETLPGRSPWEDMLKLQHRLWASRGTSSDVVRG